MDSFLVLPPDRRWDGSGADVGVQGGEGAMPMAAACEPPFSPSSAAPC